MTTVFIGFSQAGREPGLPCRMGDLTIARKLAHGLARCNGARAATWLQQRVARSGKSQIGNGLALEHVESYRISGTTRSGRRRERCERGQRAAIGDLHVHALQVRGRLDLDAGEAKNAVQAIAYLGLQGIRPFPARLPFHNTRQIMLSITSPPPAVLSSGISARRRQALSRAITA